MKNRIDFFSLKFFLYVFILLLFRKITQMNITNFITNQFMKKKEKNINLFTKRNPKLDNLNSDDVSEISEQMQIVFS
jgi:hypothetical protein